MTTQRNIAILIFDQVEVLDFCGPFEVFSVTGASSDGKDARPFNVYTVAEQAGPVIARNGLSVNPHHTLADCPPPDLMVIPGGRGTRAAMHNPTLIGWIAAQAARTELTLSVCTGALLLAKAALLDGLAATTHFSALDELSAAAPRTVIMRDQRYVDNGKIITSAGISAGIDMSLHVVGRLLGIDVARQTARYMEYAWREGQTPCA